MRVEISLRGALVFLGCGDPNDPAKVLQLPDKDSGSKTPKMDVLVFTNLVAANRFSSFLEQRTKVKLIPFSLRNGDEEAIFLIELMKRGAISLRINLEPGYVCRILIPDVIDGLARAAGIDPDPERRGPNFSTN